MSGTSLLTLPVVYTNVGVYLIFTAVYIHCHLMLSLQVITLN